MSDETGNLQQKIYDALTLIERYGGTDGAHHKQWVLDQVVRTLIGDDDDYYAWCKEYSGDTEDEDYYDEWDKGIAP